MLKAINILKFMKMSSNSDVTILNEAIAELEERQKEDKYIHQKMKESLSMGNKAQSLAFIEAYRIIDNRQ